MNSNIRSLEQQNAITEIARRHLGPCRDPDNSYHLCESEVRSLVAAHGTSTPIGRRNRVREWIRLLNEDAKPGKIFARKLKSHPVQVKALIEIYSGINGDQFVDMLDKVVNGMRESATMIADSSDVKPKRRGQSPLVIRKKELLADAQRVLKRYKKTHGLTRNGRLARFAADIWNCANGTNVGAQAFHYAIDDLQRQRHRENPSIANRAWMQHDPRFRGTRSKQVTDYLLKRQANQK